MNKTISIAKDWDAERDSYGWTLEQHRIGEDKKTGKPKKVTKKTYHPSLASILDYVVDVRAGDCQDLEEVKQMIRNLPDYLSGVPDAK